MDRLVVDAIHLDQIREHGGLPGVRDENALESALHRPRDRWSYEANADLATLAAAYCWGLARNHPYRDGNKRIAFLTMAVFVEINGYRFAAEEHDVVAVMLGVASGETAEPELAKWIRSHLAGKRSRR
jgi:death on curing protein